MLVSRRPSPRSWFERAHPAVAVMVFAALMRWEERIRTRIHSIRIPIKDPRLFFLVQCLYFVTPIALGAAFMPYVMARPDEMREQIAPPSPEAQAMIDAQKRRLQEQFNAARAQREGARTRE